MAEYLPLVFVMEHLLQGLYGVGKWCNVLMFFCMLNCLCYTLFVSLFKCCPVFDKSHLSNRHHSFLELFGNCSLATFLICRSLVVLSRLLSAKCALTTRAYFQDNLTHC